jgi:GTP-binding protein EngB required for normal cell division
MTLEKELISKSYYQTLFDGDKKGHPIQVLGEMFMDEQNNEVPDLSVIRFAQGEVYFLNKDYETAIFKWENITDDLKPWAQKNIADAHFELNLLAIAEDYYKSVETESDVLKTEVLLQLFSLYIRLGKLENAVDSIKKAVEINPDYSDVTELARTFFEDHQDWNNAIELAVNEAIRTEDLSWFTILEVYANQGLTVKMKPDYFNQALVSLYSIDPSHFANLSVALWKSYKPSELYFPWLKEMNQLLLNLELECSHIWGDLTALYKESYFELINGKLLIREFSSLIPNHLTNWLNISSTTDALVSSTAVLAWNEIFPSQVDTSVVSQAENLLSQSTRYQNGMEEGFELFESIINWAEEEGMVLSKRFEWMARELLDTSNYHLMIAGSATSGKSDFVNSLLNEEFLEDSPSATVLFKNSSEAEMLTVSDEEVRELFNHDDFIQSTKSHQSLIVCKTPISFLNENKLVLIDTPGLVYNSRLRNNVFQYLHMADGLLFVLNADSYLIGKDLEMAIRIREQAPELPIHFLLLKMERKANDQETNELIEKTTLRIDTYFPNSKVTLFSFYEESESQLNRLSAFVKLIMEGHSPEAERVTKILYYTKNSIKYLLEKQVEKENSIINKINWNEDIVTKLKGASNQLSDMEDGKVHVIKNAYCKIRDELRQNLISNIPEMLRNCYDILNEDSDFGKIHVELNNEMNKRVINYIEESVLPEFRVAIQGWIADSEGEFRDSQAYLDEMSESFNHLFGEKKMTLECDFKVLEDWRRDVGRMTRGNIYLGKANILLRSTPSQLLIKGAGKLFGVLAKNKEILLSKYKQFIAGQDYSPIAESMTDEFMQPFELFEKSLERDINMFFTTPFEVLNQTLIETQDDIKENKDALSNMRKNPEIYRDPLTLFELKIRQQEWMTTSGVPVHEYR